METELLSLLSGGADAATIVIAAGLLDLRRRVSKLEDKILYILTELARHASPNHKFTDRR